MSTSDTTTEAEQELPAKAGTSEACTTHQREQKESCCPFSWKWDTEKFLHCLVLVVGVVYAMWHYVVNEENVTLPKHMRKAFVSSPYGWSRQQDTTSSGWQTTRMHVTTCWKWFVLHPVLARAVAYVAPSLVPVFHAAYSTLFVASELCWEAAVGFIVEHAVFFAVASLRIPVLCYVTTFALIAQRMVLPVNIFHEVYYKYGMVTSAVMHSAYHWNTLRGLSFSLDFIREQRLSGAAHQRRWPFYWKTLAFTIYLPTLYLGPPLIYDQFVAQADKPKPRWTLREMAANVWNLLRSGVHFFLVEAMTHYMYCTAMSRWPWMAYSLDLTSLVGYGLALNFFFYLRLRFCYGFAWSLASVEGIEIARPAKCIARLHRCSQFWRYFDHGMHLWSRRYFYEPLIGERKSSAWKVVGTAASFGFAWFWHGMDRLATYWASLSTLGIALEIFVAEARKWQPVRNFEGRYLTTEGRMRVAQSVLGAPHYLLTIFACLFHLAEFDICIIFSKRILLGFPFPLIPILVVLYCGCYVSKIVADWEASNARKQKQATS
ncbi:protein-cysteine N-palmitoyltransferase Rasp-like isoform X2 [Haemaphysalis longicornis]